MMGLPPEVREALDAEVLRDHLRHLLLRDNLEGLRQSYTDEAGAMQEEALGHIMKNHATLTTHIDALQAENERLREANKKLHRRAQKWESDVTRGIRSRWRQSNRLCWDAGMTCGMSVAVDALSETKTERDALQAEVESAGRIADRNIDRADTLRALLDEAMGLLEQFKPDKGLCRYCIRHARNWRMDGTDPEHSLGCPYDALRRRVAESRGEE